MGAERVHGIELKGLTALCLERAAGWLPAHCTLGELARETKIPHDRGWRIGTVLPKQGDLVDRERRDFERGKLPLYYR
jgi:hypothetical protein